MQGCVSDPWLSLSGQFNYMAENLKLDPKLLRRLVERNILDGDAYDELVKGSSSRDQKMDRLLKDILPKQDPKLYGVFCKILTNVGQGDIVQRLENNLQDLDEIQDRVETIGNAEGESPTKGSAYCSFPNLRMSEVPPVTEPVKPDDDPWSAIRSNYMYLSDKLRFTDRLLGYLFQRKLITKNDFKKLKSGTLDHSAKIELLLTDILPSTPSKMFGTFCEVLHDADQRHVAERLTGNSLEVRILPPEVAIRVTTRTVTPGKVEIHVEVPGLQPNAGVQRRRSDDAEKRVDVPEAQSPGTKRRDSETEARLKEALEKVDQQQLLILALRCEKQNSKYHHKSDDPTLSRWSELDFGLPYDVQHGRLGEIEGRLAVIGVDDQLHVRTDEGDQWETFVRERSKIYRIVCRQDLSLMVVYDEHNSQYVIEQFSLNGDNKWHPVTVLPPEMQLLGVNAAVDVRNNTLYVVGGQNKSGKMEGTARMCNLETGLWSDLDDMKTKRDCCSCVIVDNTLFVGGGWTDGYPPRKRVESLHIGCTNWEEVTFTTNYHPTMAAADNLLVATGGLAQNLNDSDVVEMYDDRLREWFTLPNLTQKRCRHGLFCTKEGKLVAAGGDGIASVESLSLH